MLGVGRRACARVAASSAQRGHRVVDAPCSTSLTELVRGSAAATTGAVTTIVAQGEYTCTRGLKSSLNSCPGYALARLITTIKKDARP